MKDIIKYPELHADPILSYLTTDPEKLLFFDIETTGLSPHASSLYLIGMLYFRDGKTVFRQLFVEHLGEELPVLRAFFSFARDFDTLIHFNGDTFDIPYLETCAAQYSLACPLRELGSIDILKAVRRERKLLGLENCRQKTVERFLGIDREDIYGGGELIPVYQAYEKDNDPQKEHLLLLHNEEDVCGMPSLLPILSYRLLNREEGPEVPFLLEENYSSRSGELRYLALRFPFRFPKEVRWKTESDLELCFSGDTLKLTLPQYIGELKYFYPNYRDYFFLPKEDRAVHKKLAAYVEKPYKEPATPDTCYTKMQGTFLPALKCSGFPVFSENRKAERSWHRLEDEDDFILRYIRRLLSDDLT